MDVSNGAGSTYSVSNAAPSRVGEVLAEKYRILRKLGEGGMGDIYESEHTFVGRRFAIKFLHAELAREKEMISRFEREAKAAGALQSENIVAVTDFGFTADGAPYIVMEQLEGEDLRKLMVREGQLPVPRIVNIAIQACRGLHVAHERGIVHRDLKPENLFIARRGDGSDLVKILDFGIAKLRGQAGSSTFTRPGTMMGTLNYMPVEQIRGDKEIDQRADIYALGAILYEALAGVVPHPGDEAQAIIYHLLNQPISPLSLRRPGLPAALETAVYKALALERSERFQSVAELVQALTPFAGRQITPLESKIIPPTIKSSAETIERPLSEVRPREITTDSKEQIAERERRPVDKKRGLLFAIVGVALIVAIALAGWLVTRNASSGASNANTPGVLRPASPKSPEPNAAASNVRLADNPTAVSAKVPVAFQNEKEPAANAKDDIPTGEKLPATTASVRSTVHKTGHPTTKETPLASKPVIEPSPVAPPSETESATIPGRRGKRKVVFDTTNPY